MIFILNKNNTIGALIRVGSRGQLMSEYFEGFEPSQLNGFFEFASSGKGRVHAVAFPDEDTVVYGFEEITAKDSRYPWALVGELRNLGFEAGVTLDESREILLHLNNPELTPVGRADAIGDITNMSAESLAELKKDIAEVTA